MFTYFDPEAPVGIYFGNMPHWRQERVLYFVTFRLADSVPRSQLRQWIDERNTWLAEHPEPHGSELRLQFYQLFPERIQKWLDRDHGSCVLARPDVRRIVHDSMSHFEGIRYELDDWVIMPNHVHVLVAPARDRRLCDILHTWKSYSANRINALLGKKGPLWMKESYDHIVRNAGSHERIRRYIRSNPKGLPGDTFTLMIRNDGVPPSLGR